MLPKTRRMSSSIFYLNSIVDFCMNVLVRFLFSCVVKIRNQIYRLKSSFRSGIHTKVAMRNGWVFELDVSSVAIWMFSRYELSIPVSAFKKTYLKRTKNCLFFMLLSVTTDMNKIQKRILVFIFFRSCFAILQLRVCFQYSIFLDCAILKKMFVYNNLRRCHKSAISTPKTHINKPSQWDSKILTMKYSKM